MRHTTTQSWLFRGNKVNLRVCKLSCLQFFFTKLHFVKGCRFPQVNTGKSLTQRWKNFLFWGDGGYNKALISDTVSGQQVK